MRKTLSTLFVTVFALLLAGAAMAAPADQPVPETQPAAVQAVEAEPAATEAPLCEISVQAPPEGGPPEGVPPLEECGDVFCPPNFFCCNPLENLCVREGQVCIL